MDTLDLLLRSLGQLAMETGGELTWFANRMLGLPLIETMPNRLPACAQLKGLPDLATATTLPVVRAILQATDDLCWQQSYTHADGFSRHYLDNYGWFNLVSPEGVFANDDIRVSVGYWGAGLSYKEHWHQPEEFYLVLAGTGEFRSQGCVSRNCQAGDVVYHSSNQKHAIEMANGPLLAAAFWRGDGLLVKPDL